MMKYIEIELNEKPYALPLSETQEIIRLQPITEIPNARAYVCGVINLRGLIVPVVDLRERFHMPNPRTSNDMRIVIVKTEAEVVGLLVDRVVKVSSFGEILPPPSGTDAVERGLLAGVGRSNEDLVCLLDLNRLLDLGGEGR
ncbi:chemotaxis protein CheW [Paenibacillus rhizovicinus]|uniref:Chemotaxis protein CheW n=1 Tax=Paenibacillus rhizovicinus TaxID=2704463 RepID=A0A6C0PBW8_9BACL|nr:chemotaxis protein CheW [Paenibacillus rhizovicinus]QHW34162.1 chemotaxis protein CheW [Paenibacillus rhizovicinus]